MPYSLLSLSLSLSLIHSLTHSLTHSITHKHYHYLIHTITHPSSLLRTLSLTHIHPFSLFLLYHTPSLSLPLIFSLSLTSLTDILIVSCSYTIFPAAYVLLLPYSLISLSLSLSLSFFVFLCRI